MSRTRVMPRWLVVALTTVLLACPLAAIAASSDDGASFLRSANTYAEQQQPEKALESCLEAAGIRPEDEEIRRQCARYAEWAGDLPESITQFEHLLKLVPGDSEGLLGAARAHGWSGHLRRAGDYYSSYLEQYPGDPDAWIEYAQVRAWQGDFASALDSLEQYRERFGETPRYMEEKARYLAWDNRPRRALDINTPLLEEAPDDYERLYTQAVAQAANSQTDEALNTLQELKRIRPDSEDTLLLDRVIHTPTQSDIGAGWRYYNDSDTIEIHGIQVDAGLHATTNARLSAGASYNDARADSGSGFETIDGRETVRYQQAWAGGSYRLNPLATVSGRLGHGDVHDYGDFSLYEITLDLRPADQLELSLLRRRELHALSPRAVSLGVMRDHNELGFDWRPDYRYVVESIVSYDELSDGNEKTELVVAPRRAVLRTGKFNADVGIYFDWAAFSDDFDNGYYDPEDYRRYAASFYGYWKLGEDHGLSAVSTAGFHKDDDMNDFEFGSDIVLELTSGLYKDWMSVVTVDYSDRYQSQGTYDGWNINLSITSRF